MCRCSAYGTQEGKIQLITLYKIFFFCQPFNFNSYQLKILTELLVFIIMRIIFLTSLYYKVNLYNFSCRTIFPEESLPVQERQDYSMHTCVCANIKKSVYACVFCVASVELLSVSDY